MIHILAIGDNVWQNYDENQIPPVAVISEFCRHFEQASGMRAGLDRIYLLNLIFYKVTVNLLVAPADQ